MCSQSTSKSFEDFLLLWILAVGLATGNSNYLIGWAGRGLMKPDSRGLQEIFLFEFTGENIHLKKWQKESLIENKAT